MFAAYVCYLACIILTPYQAKNTMKIDFFIIYLLKIGYLHSKYFCFLTIGRHKNTNDLYKITGWHSAKHCL